MVFRNDDGIWIASSDGEAPRQLRPKPENELSNQLAWSRRGTRVVYSRRFLEKNRWRQSIESCDLEGGSPTTLVSIPGLGRHFVMLEDRIVFVRHERPPRYREENLWEVRVDPETLEPKGKPRRLTDWVGFRIVNLSATADGKQLVFRKHHIQSDVFVGDVADGGRRLEGIRRLSLHKSYDAPAAWTADSSSVIYNSNRNGPMGVFHQGLDERTATALVVGTRRTIAGSLTPDGASILYWSRAVASEEARSETPYRLMRIPATGGPSEIVLEAEDNWPIRCSREPEGGCVLVERDEENRRDTLYRLDPVEGQGSELMSREYSDEAEPEWSLSPDGRRLVLVGDETERRTFRVFDLSGALLDEIELKGHPGAGLDNVAWAVDGRGIYFVADSPRGEILGFVEPDGTNHVLVDVQSEALGSIRPSPDGRRLAYRMDTTESNVWTIDEF